MITKETRLATAIASGTNLKPDFPFGKEYYAVWIGVNPTDVILDWLYAKAKELVPNAPRFSVVGLYWELFHANEGMMKSKPGWGMVFIHKGLFKRHIRKAITRARRAV